MKKTRLFILIVFALLLFVLAGCGDTNVPDGNSGENGENISDENGGNIPDNGSEEDNTATEAPMFTVESVGELSAETKAEIEKAWFDFASKERFDESELKLEWCQKDDHYLKARYYGTFDEGVVFFKEKVSMLAVVGTISLSDYEFLNGKIFNIYIYKNGEIQNIRLQIESLDEEDIEDIWNAHIEYQKYLYPECYEAYCVLGILNPLTDEMKQEIETVWKEKRGCDLIWAHQGNPLSAGVRVYGEFNGYTVLFDEKESNGHSRAMYVGEYRFSNQNVFEIWLYKNGELHTLSSAYESGLVPDDVLREIFVCHRLCLERRFPFWVSSGS